MPSATQIRRLIDCLSPLIHCSIAPLHKQLLRLVHRREMADTQGSSVSSIVTYMGTLVANNCSLSEDPHIHLVTQV